MSDPTNSNSLAYGGSNGSSLLPERPTTERWWENYFVRYFVGTVVGVVVVLAFRSFALTAGWFEGIIPDLKDLTGGDVALVIGLGLAYCYIASTPVLTLHASRGLNLGGKWPWFVKGILLVSLGLPGAAYALVASGSLKFHWFGWTLILLFVVPQIIALRCAAKSNFDSTGLFYKNLVIARRRDWAERHDFVESYKHLREHGNAVLIVICEIALGAALAVMNSVTEVVIALVVWLSPAASTWFIGSIFEAKFAAMRGNWELEEANEKKKPSKW